MRFKPRSRFRFSSSNLSEAQFAYLFILPLVVLLLSLNLFPILYSLWSSLRNIRFELRLSEFVGLAQYVRAFRDPRVPDAFIKTITYTAEVTVIAFTVSLPAALLLNERFRGRKLLSTIIILPWGISTYATAIVWRYMYFENIGLFNAILSRLGVEHPVVFLSAKYGLLCVAVAHAWQLAPLGVYFILASLQVIPPDLHRAAKIDRLGVFGRFRHVTLPYIRSSLLVIMVLITVEAARVFDIIYFSTSGGPGDATTTLTYLINLTAFHNFDIGYASALSWILLIIVLCINTAYFQLLFRAKREGTA